MLGERLVRSLGLRDDRAQDVRSETLALPGWTEFEQSEIQLVRAIIDLKHTDPFSVDLDDPSIIGSTDADLLTSVVFSLERTAIRDVIVEGNAIVRDGRHPKHEIISREYLAASRALWEAA